MAYTLEHDPIDAGHLIAVTGELDLAATPELSTVLLMSARSPGPLVVLDLAGVEFIDSTALGTLLKGGQEVEEAGKVMRVVCAERPALGLQRERGQPVADRRGDRGAVGLQPVVAVHPRDGTPGGVRRHPERVALALDDEHGDRDGVQLGEPRPLRPPRRVDGEREAQHAGRAGLPRRAARHPRARGPPAAQHRDGAAYHVDDRDPRRVELVRGRRRLAARHAVGLLDERDTDPRLVRDPARGDEVRRGHPAAGAVPEHQQRPRAGYRVLVHPGRPVRRVDVAAHSVVTARSTSTFDARRAGGIAASTPAIAARIVTAINVTTGNVSTKPSSASGRETMTAKTTPSTSPSTAPISAVITDSARTMRRTWRRLMPTARSRPSSRVRSWTASASVLTIPSSATMTDRASRPNTSPSSWLTWSADSSLNWVSVCALAIGKSASARLAFASSVFASPRPLTRMKLSSGWFQSLLIDAFVTTILPSRSSLLS